MAGKRWGWGKAYCLTHSVDRVLGEGQTRMGLKRRVKAGLCELGDCGSMAKVLEDSEISCK